MSNEIKYDPETKIQMGTRLKGYAEQLEIYANQLDGAKDLFEKMTIAQSGDKLDFEVLCNKCRKEGVGNLAEIGEKIISNANGFRDTDTNLKNEIEK